MNPETRCFRVETAACVPKLVPAAVPIRTPKLVGLVVNDDEVNIGMLEDCIDNIGTLGKLRTFLCGSNGIEMARGKKPRQVRLKKL